MATASSDTPVLIPPLGLEGELRLPAVPFGLVVFAHGSGSSRHSPRNRRVAAALADAGLATLLFDLLTVVEAGDRDNVFDIDLLADRLVNAIDWVGLQPELSALPLGLFGASTGAAAALIAAARRPEAVAAVVSRGGRPDLAEAAAGRVRAPTLLIVGGDDTPVIGLNRLAQARLRCPNRLEIVPGASHLFEEPGALEAVTRLTIDWFASRMAGGSAEPDGLG